MEGRARRGRRKNRGTLVSPSLKEEGWIVPQRPKTLSRERKEMRRLQLPLRKKNPNRWRRLQKTKRPQSRKGLRVAKVAESQPAPPLPPPRLRGAPRQPSLVTPTTRGLMRIDTLPRRGGWTSPRTQERRRRANGAGRRARKAATRSLGGGGGGAPGLPPSPPLTLTTVEAGRSIG